MAEFEQVTTKDQVPVGTMISGWAGGRKILVYNVDGEYYATDEQCTHRECSLQQGRLNGKIVSCPCHNARFDVTTGAVLSAPATVPLPMYKVQVKGNRILVEIDATDIL